jgi:hypothetical protein
LTEKIKKPARGVTGLAPAGTRRGKKEALVAGILLVTSDLS